MYKELYKEENSPYLELLPTKGSFLDCVPERDIMLTIPVYHIHLHLYFYNVLNPSKGKYDIIIHKDVNRWNYLYRMRYYTYLLLL